MKVLFVGPSLAHASPHLNDIESRPPAACGDILAAVLQGATVIGLVDGAFGSVAAVWHKEILYALSHGVRVLGSSSMGALRAAECAAFGMEPIGRVAYAYLRGELVDDADVALLMLPQSAGGAALTDPLVDALATMEHLAELKVISPDEHLDLRTQAKRLHFTHRTANAICRVLGERADAVEHGYRTHFTSVKQADALELVTLMKTLPDRLSAPPTGWALSQPPLWQEVLRDCQSRQTILHSSTASLTPIFESTLPR